MRLRAWFAALAVLFLGLALTACPPPPDVNGGGGEETAVETPPDRTDPGGRETPVTDADASPPPDAPTPIAEGDDEPRAATGDGDVARRIVYRRVQGGTYVPRCPACGEVQPDGSTKCGGCGQALTPYEHRVTCAGCGGSGADARSGDDRPCRACNENGQCPYCEGTGNLGSTPCADCEGSGQCAACAADGVRESFHGDFGPLETTQPGVCPTCIDGSGLCPDCGSRGKTHDGEPCVTCSESGLCFDCVKTGRSPHDAGEGRCLICVGTGLEVRNGSVPGPAERHWTLRKADSGLVIRGWIDRPPSINVHIREQPRASAKALTRHNLSPLSWYRVQRHWADSAADFEKLAEFAQGQRLWPLALVALRRAEQNGADDGQVKAMRLGVRAAWLSDWLEHASAALKAGDHATALLYTQMVRFEGMVSDTGAGPLAVAMEVRIRQALEKAEEAITEEMRTQQQETARARLKRIVARFELRISLCRRLLREAEDQGNPDAARERLYDRADRAAWSAMRLVQREAARWSGGSGLWPEGREPRRLLDQAKRQRGLVVAAHASRAVQAGRYAQGKHLAERARLMTPGDERATNAFIQAEKGLQRQGVIQGSPPR